MSDRRLAASAIERVGVSLRSEDVAQVVVRGSTGPDAGDVLELRSISASSQPVARSGSKAPSNAPDLP